MKARALSIAPLVVLLLACSLSAPASSPTAPSTATAPPPATPQPPAPAGGSERRCGDGICDGPEDATVCPEDCGDHTARTPQADAPGSAEAGSDEHTYWVTNPTSGARLYVLVLHPGQWAGDPLPTLVLIPGGTGDSSHFLEPRPSGQRLADGGFAIVIFDPDGRGKSGGQEDQNGHTHQDGLAAIIQFAATLPEVDPDRIGIVTWSYGVTMGSGVLARHPELPVRFLIDWEGPANRDDTGGCDESKVGHLQGHPCDDEAFWVEREASTFALGLQVPYQRYQSQEDHAQPDNDHALLMINNATAETHGGHGRAPWTRLNGLAPNTVHDLDDPPAMIAEDQEKRVEQMIVHCAEELFAME